VDSGQDRRGALTGEGNVSFELGKAQTDEAMQLTPAITVVLGEPVEEANELPELIARFVNGRGGGRAFLDGEASDAERIEGVGLGAPQVLLVEALCAERIKEGYAVASLAQGGEEVAPVVSGGLHRHEDIVGGAEEANILS
jgi:hypothetical protein